VLPLQRSPSCAAGDFLAELLFRVFSQRYERGSTIVTSNHAQRRLPHGLTERLHREANDQKRLSSYDRAPSHYRRHAHRSHDWRTRGCILVGPQCANGMTIEALDEPL